MRSSEVWMVVGVRMAWASVAWALASCSCDPSQPVCRTDCTDAQADAPRDTNWSLFDGAIELDGGCAEAPTQITISPSSTTLNVIAGTPTRQSYDVRVLSANGNPVGGTIAFRTTPRNIGVMFDATTFEANGIVGGQVLIRAAYSGCGRSLEADATLSVNITQSEVAGAGTGADADRVAAPSDAAASFAAATASTETVRTANEASVVYPLDHAVMPLNVFPADVQWTRGAVGDVFRVRMIKPHFNATVYLGYSAQRHYLANETIWRSFTQSDGDVEASIQVDRLSGNTVHIGTPVHVSFANAALTGSVYYWDVLAGRIVRIDDGVGTATQFMPSPPRGATMRDGDCDGNATAEASTRCVGCHSVSPSGRYMAGRLGTGNDIGAVFDLTRDLTGQEPPTTYDLHADDFAQQTSYWMFASWRPDEQMLVASMHEDRNWCPPVRASNNRRMGFVNPATGREVAGTGLPAEGTQPAWAPNGNQIAYVSSFEPLSPCKWGDWGCFGGTSSVGNISVMDVSGTTASNLRVLHTATTLRGAPEGGDVDCYPSWTPDSRHLAFHHGTLCRTNSIARRTSSGNVVTDVESTRVEPRGALYWMQPDGQGVTRLDRANGSGVDNFNPNFTPFTSGGYYWLVFVSRRAYGNDRTGTAGVSDANDPGNNSGGTTAGRQQLWITAVRADGTGDPSSVPYWLPGQRTTSKNIAAYYAPRACREQGVTCGVGSECCGGECQRNNAGVLVCMSPTVCRPRGQTCFSDADCCDREQGTMCISHVCETLLQ